MHHFILTIWFLPLFPFFGQAADQVKIQVNGMKLYQRFEGFGATTLSLVHEPPLGDPLGADLRRQALEALYGQVRLTMGNLSVGLLESPAGWKERQNDNDDPFRINWKGFNTFAADSMWRSLVKPASSLGFDNYSLQGHINWRWSSPWLKELFHKDRHRCLEEGAEQVEACVIYWRKISGTVPRYVHLFNEPTSGNGEIAGADAAMVRDIVIHAGRRLRAAGFKDIKFIVPNEETIERSLAVARVILENAEARDFLGAIGYHVYPYGSPYASVPRILHASGQGRPDRESVEQRRRLRDLARRFNLPLWMTEVSHGELDPRSFDHLRGRAIHIHDEMVYADAAAFYGMNAMWDKKNHADHFAGRGGEDPQHFFTEQDTIVLIDNQARRVLITGMGYAIGHYARWIKRGADRLDGASDDPLVQVTAFRNLRPGNFVLVAINNSPHPRTLNVTLDSVFLQGQVTGEQSHGHQRWQPLRKLDLQARDRFQATVPGLSVTTFVANLGVTS